MGCTCENSKAEDCMEIIKQPQEINKYRNINFINKNPKSYSWLFIKKETL